MEIVRESARPERPRRPLDRTDAQHSARITTWFAELWLLRSELPRVYLTLEL